MLLFAACEDYPADLETLEPPSVTALQVTPDSVDISSGAAQVTARLGTRSGSGIDSAVVHLQGPGGGTPLSCVARAPSDGTRTDGTWSCEFTLEQNAGTGVWLVTGIDAFPSRGDMLRVGDADLAAAGYARGVRAVSGTRPTVAISAPARGSSFVRGDSIRFAGAAADGSGTPLTGSALAWSSSIDGTLGTGAPLVRTDLSLGEHLITLTATDANGATALDSTRITVAAHLPVAVVVVTPGFGEVAAPGDTLRFRAAAFTVDAREIGNVVFSWSSSDTAVARVNPQGLATATGYGRADITAAVDSVAGSAVFTVRLPDPPTVAITAPAAGAAFETGSAITFTGTATDAAGAALTGAALAWSSSLDGAIGTGASFTRSDLSLGDHTITLAATDTGGRSSTATVDIAVRAPGAVAWVAAGDGGSAILSSADGIAWTARPSPLGRGRAVARSTNLWVVTGDVDAADGSTALVTSSDGISWTARTTPFNNTAFAVAWNGEIWLAGAAARSGSSTLAISADGINWTTTGVTPFTIATLGLAWNGRAWVAVGAGGRGTGTTIAHSTNGIDWTASQSPFGTSTTIDNAGWGIAWNGRMWVAVGQGATALATSTDGITWTPRATPMTRGYAIAWNGSTWVAGGAGGTSIMTSTDGVTWTARTAPLTAAHGVAWDGQQWVATGTGATTVATSPDGITWTARTAPLTAAWGVAGAQPIVPPPLPDAPTVTIASPADGASYEQGTAIPFAGSAVDGLGEPVVGDRLAWTSSISGMIGTGASFTRGDLAVGTHTITLTATDVRGVPAAATIVLTVRPREVGPIAGVIAYSSNSRLRTINADGTGSSLWDRLGISSSWSPDGGRIAFTVNSRLWVMNSDGSDARRLTEFQSASPTWSPDGNEIAIQSSVDGQSWSLLSIDPVTGDSVRRITGTPDQDQFPDWSPSGDRITVARSGALAILRASDGAVLNTYAVGTTIRHPRWSPDGTKIAFTRAEAGGRRSLHILDVASGTATTFLNEATLSFEYPTWSPDGNYIAYSRRPDGGRFDIWIARADGSGAPVALTSDQAVDDSHADWVLELTTPISPPAVTITAPASGASVDEGSAVTFTGSAVDYRGAALTGAALAWTSSIDGDIGTGNSFTRSTLSVGAHTIRLTATDEDGRRGTASIDLTVRVSGPAAWVVAGDGSSAIVSSSDGIHWTARPSPLGRGRAVARSADLWVATGDISAADGSTSLVTSTDGITWTARATPFDNTAFTVAWDGQLWLAGAAARSGSATMAMSTDGTTWTTAGVTPFTIATLGLAWNGQLWVAVGAGGRGTGTTIARSPDGISWVASESPFGTSTTIDNAGWGVAWNGQMWVAVGNGTTALATSGDAVTWTPRTTPMTRGYAIAWNGSLWVAAGSGGATIMTSPDGVNWTARTAPFTAAYGIAWDGQQWVATGTGASTVATSPDGITWTARTAPLNAGWGVAGAAPILPPAPPQPPTVTITSPTDGAVYDQGDPVAFGGTAQAASGTSLTGSSLVWTSSIDGQIGTGSTFLSTSLSPGAHVVTLTATDANGLTGTAQVTITVNAGAGSGMWVAVGRSGTRIATSTDGISWTARASHFEWLASGVAYNGSMWVVVGEALLSGSGPSIAWSADGITWTPVDDIPFTRGNHVAWNGAMWVAAGQGGATIATSTDGVNWTARTAPFTTSANGVAWGGGQWVAVGRGGTQIATSPDGITWTARSSPFPYAGNGVAWNGSMWVVAGDATFGTGATIATSTDGESWTQVSANPMTQNASSVAWNGSMWVGVGRSQEGAGVIATSPDGATWTAQASPFTTAANSIGWNGSYWVAGGQGDARLATSTDGITWTVRTTPFTQVVAEVAWSRPLDQPWPPPEPAVLSAIVVEPQLVAVTGSGTAQFTATAYDQFQRMMPGIPFTWSTSNPCVATVDGTGLARTAAAPGSAQIRASAGDITGSGTYQVQQPQGSAPASLTGDWVICNTTTGQHYLTLHLVHEEGSEIVTGTVTMANGTRSTAYNGRWQSGVFSIAWDLIVQGGARTFSIVGGTAYNENVIVARYNDRYTLQTHDVHMVRQ
jgi:hypothetical protein